MGLVAPEMEVADLCEKSAVAIAEKKGFVVKIVCKAHLYFREWCQSPSQRSEMEVEPCFLAHGSCIPLALARLFPGKKDDIRSEINKENQRNSEAARLGSRSYKTILASDLSGSSVSKSLKVTRELLSMASAANRRRSSVGAHVTNFPSHIAANPFSFSLHEIQ